MAPLEHTVSLGMAGLLRDAGWPQGLAQYYYSPDDQGAIMHWRNLKTKELIERQERSCYYAAPTLTELLEKLPEDMALRMDQFFYSGSGLNWEFAIELSENDTSEEWHEAHSPNPCDAAAELVLWCVEQGYIKFDGGAA